MEINCVCEKISCKESCVRDHTHKNFFCKKCKPENHSYSKEEAYITHESPSPESWEEEFDKVFMCENGATVISSDSIFRFDVEKIKLFISKTLVSEREKWEKERFDIKAFEDGIKEGKREARTQLISELKEKMPKEKDILELDLILPTSMKLAKEVTRENWAGYNSCLSNVFSILNKLENHE